MYCLGSGLNVGEKMRPTDEYIKTRHKQWLHEIDIKDQEQLSHVNEKLRAMWVLQSTYGTMKPAAAMSLYMVRQDIAKEILAEFGVDDAFDSASKKRSDKYSTIQAWCKENVLAQVSAKQVAEVGEISYPTALKYISNHPDVFWKIGHGTYEIRDPVEDRKKEKK